MIVTIYYLAQPYRHPFKVVINYGELKLSVDFDTKNTNVFLVHLYGKKSLASMISLDESHR